MFIKVAEWLQKSQSNLIVPQRAVVKDNNDPDKRCGIKVVIKDFIEDPISIDDLPWYYPLNSYGLGGRVDLSSMTIPEIGTEVIIVFPYNDIYFGFYTATWQSDTTHQAEPFDESYPESYGWIDSLVQWLKVNKEEQYTELYRRIDGTGSRWSNELIRVDKEGNLWINIPNNLNIKVNNDINLEVTNDVITKILNNLNLKILNNSNTLIQNNQNVQVSGAVSLKTSGNHTLKVDNSCEIDAGSDYGVNAGSMITHEAPMIYENSGKTLGIAPGNIDSGISDLESKISSLDSEMNALKAKLDELKSTADNIKSNRDTVKSNLDGII